MGSALAEKPDPHPEAAAHIGRIQNSDLALGHTKRFGEDHAAGMWSLGRRPDRDAAVTAYLSQGRLGFQLGLLLDG